MKQMIQDFIDTYLITTLKKVLRQIGLLGKLVLFALLSGVVIGGISALFAHCITYVTQLRASHPALILLLPAGGLLIVCSYRLLHSEKDGGTNLVLSAIQSGDAIPVKMAPLIFISTVITHLFGGSSGREGAALQLGGSLGHFLGKLLRIDESDKHLMIMCGMSAAFSALFGTPLAATVFSMEVVSVGIMHYSALVPCAISALTAHYLALWMGVSSESFSIVQIPDFSIYHGVQIGLLAMACAGISVLFCILLHQTEHLYQRLFKNPYLRIVVGGGIIILLTVLVGSFDYNGTGMEVITRAVNGEVLPWAFVLKMIFTALTLGAGYKGGEIVPSLFIGSTFGCLFGGWVGLSPSLCAAVGMGAVFCGVTNSPITSLLICFELFGLEAMPYYLVAIAISYLLSGYFGLYHSQKIIYSKYKTEYINRKTN
jgi:H+/Cl- antiporter ClcA